MCGRWLFKLSVVCVVVLCVWYSLTHNIRPVSTTCENLPPNNFIHPVLSFFDSPPVKSEPRSSFYPNLTIVPENICDSNTSIIIVIHSDLRNFERRKFQRNQLNDKWLEKISARRVFVVGFLPDNDKKEDQSGDVLQMNIIENYHSITYKAQSWVRLMASCKQPPKLVIKMDDDVAIDKLGVEYLIQRYGRMRNMLACRVFSHGAVVRNPKSKWYLSRNEYSSNDLGTYCQGMAYIFSGDQLNVMNDNIDKVQFLWMDDWYVTRGLLNGTNTTLFNLGEHYLAINSESELKVALDRRKQNKTYRSIFGHFRPAERFPPPRLRELWDEVTSLNNKC